MTTAYFTSGTVRVPNAPFFKEVEHLLWNNMKVIIYVQGGSMRPFLRNGDKILLVPVTSCTLSEGMIVLAHTSAGVLLHRIVHMRKDKDEIRLAGDANSRQTECITRKHIIGVADKAWRGERLLPVNSFSRRVLAFLWYLLRPFRGYILKITEGLK